MLGLCIGFSVVALLPGVKSSSNYTAAVYDSLATINVELEKQKPKHVKPAALQKPTTPMIHHAATAIKVVKANEALTELIDLGKLAVGFTNDSSGISIGPAEDIANTGDGGALATPAPVIQDTHMPEENPDVPPAFPGGLTALRVFLERNLQSPEEINEAVKVTVKFIVGYDGKLESFEILKDGGSAFNQEVIRVLKKMPQWIPGEKDGKNVKAYCYLPVKFAPTE